MQIQLKQAYHSLILVVIALVLQGCAAGNAISKAETTEQRAFATYGTYVIIKEQAAKLAASGQISNSAILAIGQARDRANPIVDSLLKAVEEFQAIREEYREGGIDAETRYLAAINNLNAWITRADPVVKDLTRALQGAKR